MYKKVLIPVDMSDFGEQVLPVVKAVIPADKAELTLVYCIEPHKYVYGGATDDQRVIDSVVSDIQPRASDYLYKLKKELQSDGYTVATRIGQGDAAEFIVDAAQEQGVELIAMTTHGRTGVIREALGSVADRVMRTAVQPVLLVRNKNAAADKHPIRRILVPLDGSQLSEEALAHAKEITKKTGASIHLLHVLQPMQDWAQQLQYGADRPFETMAEPYPVDPKIYLERIRQNLEAAQHSVTTKLYTGIVGDEILNAAQSEEADLIVMGSHGYGSHKRWVYGSIANRVVHEAPCPLIMIRTVPEGNGESMLVDASMSVGI